MFTYIYWLCILYAQYFTYIIHKCNFIHLLTFKTKALINWFEIISERGESFHPQVAATAIAGLCPSLEPETPSGSPTWVTRAQSLGSSYTGFPGTLAGRGMGRGAAGNRGSTLTGCQYKLQVSFAILQLKQIKKKKLLNFSVRKPPFDW